MAIFQWKILAREIVTDMAEWVRDHLQFSCGYVREGVLAYLFKFSFGSELLKNCLICRGQEENAARENSISRPRASQIDGRVSEIDARATFLPQENRAVIRHIC